MTVDGAGKLHDKMPFVLDRDQNVSTAFDFPELGVLVTICGGYFIGQIDHDEWVVFSDGRFLSSSVFWRLCAKTF